MYALGRVSVIALFSLCCLSACKAGTQTPTPLNSINAPQGGRIVYGPLNGATSQSAALGRMLRSLHNNCGEKPEIGRVFQFRGSNSVGLFFTVTDHPDGNLPLAGMVIATMTGPNTVEAGMVYDVASRFAQTVNPMLEQLSGVWHPGAASAPTSRASATAQTRTAQAGPALALHQVTLPDETATVSLPAGWTVDPKSGGGGMLLHGPHGELSVLGNMYLATDPYGQAYRNLQRMGTPPLKGTVIYPANVDMTKVLNEIFQAIRRSKGLTPDDLKMDTVQQAPVMQGARCVYGSGHLTLNGTGPAAIFRILCAATPDAYGDYAFYDYYVIAPNAFADQGGAIANALFASFKVNLALVTARANAEAAPHIAQLQQNYNIQQQAMLANGARIVGNINQIGANATAFMNAQGAAHDAQHAQWSAGQVENSRNIQGFSNYLLDQTVVQNNYTGEHGTGWNAAADALIKSDSNKYSYVNTPNYVPGTDF
jgi:hypothetical protein